MDIYLQEVSRVAISSGCRRLQVSLARRRDKSPLERIKRDAYAAVSNMVRDHKVTAAHGGAY
jgi:hypothetical protein